MDVDYVGASMAEAIDQRGGTTMVQPLKNAPLGREMCTKLLLHLGGAGADGDDYEVVVVDRLVGVEVLVHQEHLLLDLAHRHQGLDRKKRWQVSHRQADQAKEGSNRKLLIDSCLLDCSLQHLHR